ncbi:hypothetical protein ZIOFF_045721 [Zingiber officinale]|uniref:Uncharacterized protein n=1 Tax=Zingiber officinale TaxID=94328 RepID=A0A8J5L1D6_ZINOF|nr:hypothetical protein ZIOFF_045721 [Zingiber officinale]
MDSLLDVQAGERSCVHQCGEKFVEIIDFEFRQNDRSRNSLLAYDGRASRNISSPLMIFMDDTVHVSSLLIVE